LYLIEISACNLDFDSGKADLKMLFGDKFINGRVKADWFTDTLYVDIKSKDTEDLWTSSEYEFQFRSGKLISTRLFNNYDRRSFYENRYELHEFVYKRINWRGLPTLKNDTVIVLFTADSNGTIDSTRVVQGAKQIFIDEVVKAVRAVPQWSVSYYRGAFRRYDVGVRVVFSEENRRRYRR